MKNADKTPAPLLAQQHSQKLIKQTAHDPHCDQDISISFELIYPLKILESRFDKSPSRLFQVMILGILPPPLPSSNTPEYIHDLLVMHGHAWSCIGEMKECSTDPYLATSKLILWKGNRLSLCFWHEQWAKAQKAANSELKKGCRKGACPLLYWLVSSCCCEPPRRWHETLLQKQGRNWGIGNCNLWHMVILQGHVANLDPLLGQT